MKVQGWDLFSSCWQCLATYEVWPWEFTDHVTDKDSKQTRHNKARIATTYVTLIATLYTSNRWDRPTMVYENFCQNFYMESN